MRLDLVTAPTDTAVNLAEAFEFLRIDDEDTDEALMYRLIRAATSEVEEYTGRALMSQTWDLKLDGWWRWTLDLPKAPLQSVTSVTYLDTAGDSQTWASSNYVVDAATGPDANPGRLAKADGISFPDLDTTLAPVTVRFVAGYADRFSVPEILKQGLLVLIADMYESRLSTIVGTNVMPHVQTWKRIVNRYRVRGY